MQRKLKNIIVSYWWWTMFHLIRYWADNYMDQFESFKFKGRDGIIYCSITRQTQYPMGFEPFDKNGKALPLDHQYE